MRSSRFICFIKYPLRSVLAGLAVLCFLFPDIAAFGQAPEHRRISNMTDTVYIDDVLDRSEQFLQSRNTDSARSLLKEALRQSLTLGYRKGSRKATRMLMLAHYNDQEFTYAISYAHGLIPLCDTIQNRGELQTAYNVLGLSYDALENFQESFDNYARALHYAVNSLNRGMIYNNMSVLMQNVRQYQKSLDFVNKGLAEETNPNIKTLLLTNKAAIYNSLNDYERALSFYDSAVVYAPTANSLVDVRCRKMFFFNSLGSRLNALKEFELIRPYLDKDSLTPQNKAKVFIAAGGVYCDAGDYVTARSYLQQAEALSGFLLDNDKRVLQNSLVKLYYKTGHYKTAYDLHTLYHKLEDSIRSRDIQIRVSEQETRYRTVQKDKALAEQRVRLLEAHKMLYRNWLISGAVVTCLVVLLLLLWLRYSYQKRKNLELLASREINRLQVLMEGEERERTRLSQELHDGINSSLAATASYLRLLKEHHPGIGESVPFQKVRELLQSTSAEVRVVAHNLASHNLIKSGLKQALEEYCSNLFLRDTSVEIQVFGDEGRLSDYLSLLLYRIAQELLHNVHKHARAGEVIVILGILEDEVRLTVEDNGLGIADPDHANEGIGLNNLRSRIFDHKGSFHVESGAGSGTAVHISFPIQAK